MRIYGIGAAENSDNSGETIIVKNIDTSKLRGFVDEHGSDAWSIIGGIDYFKKIHALEECEDNHQRRCWDSAQVPFLFVRGTIADESGHPNAIAAASLLKFTALHPELPLKVGLSIEGGIVERSGPGDKTLSKTIATGVAFTVKPCNPKCALFMENDLQKSDFNAPPPKEYYEALKKSDATTSFRENKMLVTAMLIEDLKKSVNSYYGSFTHLKCYRCGDSTRFFKSSRDIPNRCTGCGSAFHMSDIYKAMKQ